jgi:glycyl-tRNA synthetase alpha subunit
MKSVLGKFLAIFFAACFLGLQFHPVGDTQLEQSAKQIFHIEDVSSSVIDKIIDNSFIYGQVFQSKHAYLSQQNTEVKQQRQFLETIERQVEHAFRQFMHECLAAICQDYQDKLFTTFNHLQKLELSYEFNPILISNRILVHSDESNSQISLS